MDEANPNVQHFIYQYSFITLIPLLPLEFEVHFSEEELQSVDRFCTKAKLVDQRNYDSQVFSLYEPSLIWFLKITAEKFIAELITDLGSSLVDG